MSVVDIEELPYIKTEMNSVDIKSLFKYAVPLDNDEKSPCRLLLQGASGTGKTTSALTFPNLLIADFDHKLGDHRHRSDVSVLPFYSKGFLEKLVKDDSICASVMIAGQINSALIFLEWIKKHAPTIPEDVTLVIDSGNMLITSLDVMIDATDKKKEDREPVNKYAAWGRKKVFVEELMTHFKKLKCRLIYIAHESFSQDQDGNSLGKMNPLISGSAKDNFPGNFTHRFRQTVEENKETKKMEFWWYLTQNKLCDCFCPLNKDKTPKVIADYKNITWQ